MPDLGGFTRPVLLVEDNPVDVDLTKRAFARRKLTNPIEVARDGEEALACIARWEAGAPTPLVILLDLKLPRVSGLEVLAHRQAQLLREQAELRTTAERLRQLLAANPTILYVLAVDGTSMTPHWISENVTRVYGYSVDECLQPGWWPAGLHADDRERVLAERLGLFANHSLTHEYRFHDKAGAVRWVRDDMRLLFDAAGKPSEVAGSWSDISISHEANERQQLQAAALNSTRDAVMITDLDARVLYVNPACTEITGYAEAEIVGRNPRLLQSGRHDRAFFEHMWARLRKHGHWQGELWNRRKNADIYPQWQTISAVRDARGQATHYVAMMTDLTVVKRSEEQLEQLAHYDPLTNLPNRLLLRSLLQHALEKARRLGLQVGLLFLNLDKFKTVNDSLGHAAGDQLLLAVSGRLKERLGAQHLLGRLSADEFVVVLEALQDPADAESVAFDLRIALDRPLMLEGLQEVYTRTSIGISIFPQDGNSADDLLHHADTAVHRAKERGGNLIAFYTTELSARALAQLEMEAGLRRALEQQRFILHFQPKIDIVSGRITGAEALLRWQRPEQGLVYPSEFIPFAEKSGQIVAIGAWIIDEACRQIRAWHDAGLGDINVAVNVSARQFRSEELETVIADALLRHAVKAHQLTLELTESMLMEAPERTIERLNRMKDKGLQLALDDFGTGYSSLAYLCRLPMDQLKIDRSFVIDIVTDPNAANIASSIIDLAHRMQLKVIAEGVETAAQLSYLGKSHCDEIQGYYFSKPVPADEFAMQLQEGKSLVAPGDPGAA
jgi:diguanylate cyclase (GGDEF)-like protein/PAS domain S-box-containing protein